MRRPAFQLLWHKPFPNAQQLFDVCATERLFVSQHADFQARPGARAASGAQRNIHGNQLNTLPAFKAGALTHYVEQLSLQ